VISQTDHNHRIWRAMRGQTPFATATETGARPRRPHGTLGAGRWATGWTASSGHSRSVRSTMTYETSHGSASPLSVSRGSP